MSHPVLLNNVDHHDLRVVIARGARYGDDAMLAPTFPREFRDLQAYYPIVFRQTRDGFLPVALLGLREGENLFLEEGADGACWDAHYVPLAIERLPFLIGAADGEPMLHIDLDHPRVTRGGDAPGQPLFLEHGGSTPFLQRMASLMRTLHDGLQENAAFGAALARLDLLEPFVLNAQTGNGAQCRLSGFHTLAEERLRALDGQALHALARADYLEPIYMALASLSHLRDLIGRMERRHAFDR
ncbi:MAG TPA: peptidase [Xanthomonadaceae bacterium]|nr:peptidase [Xanthomonadaceae bacterium]